MIRIEIIRRIDCNQGKGRNRVNPVSVFFAETVAEAIEDIRATARAAQEIAPGYMPMTDVLFYDREAFNANPLKAVPFRALNGKALAFVINVPGQTA